MHGRHQLPWQNTRDAYRVWLSEIMLQQTQVAAVIPYYHRFLERFPDLASLASAPQEDVMAHWSGLGYYTRARNLHQCAKDVMAQYDGHFPDDPALLAQLPGIGRSTAAAIAAFSHGVRAAILDGNVKRVFARVFGVDGYPGEKKVEEQLWLRAQALLPNADGIESYTQGLMDLGASLCTRSRPACERCPLRERCVALASDRVAELPVKKPKKAQVNKFAHLLVILVEGQVLLETRPPFGIWGGLLSLPEVAGHAGEESQMSVAEIKAFATMHHGKVKSCSALPSFSHAFTHFTLHVQPWRIELEQKPIRAAQGEQVWRKLDDCAGLGLPAPVKKLLLNLPLA
jgi:A/G-specific adenine glycosylase